MFIELIKPKVLPIYRTKDQTKLRVVETGAPGRLVLNLTFKDDKEAREFVEGLVFEINRELPKE